MDDYAEPGYTVDFKDEVTRMRIRGAKEGESVTVKVRLIGKPDSSRLNATGVRTKDGLGFEIRVETGLGTQRFGWNYEDILILVDARGKP